MNTRFYAQSKGRIDVMSFLAKDVFLPITYPLSIGLAVGFTGLLIYNYVTTYLGFNNSFPELWWWVALAFTAVVQGVQLAIPLLEAFNLHEDLPFGWRVGLWIGWFVAILADFYTAVVALATAAALVLTAGIAIFDKMVWTTGKGWLILMFGFILITAEIWVVLCWRLAFFLHPKFWTLVENKVTVPSHSATQPASSVTQYPPAAIPVEQYPPSIPRAQHTAATPVTQYQRPAPRPTVTATQTSFTAPEPTYHPVGMGYRSPNDKT